MRATGALPLLAACFIAAGVLKAGHVVAAFPEPGPAPAAPPGGHSADPGRADPATDGLADASPAAVTRLATELGRQREMLARREAALTDREQLLEALEERLRDRLAQLAAAQRRLEETAVLVDDAAAKDVRRLAEMYQQMKPKQAGQIFDEMEPSFAAGFLAEMRPDAAALVMANMKAEKAYAVSLLLAGRNAARN